MSAAISVLWFFLKVSLFSAVIMIVLGVFLLSFGFQILVDILKFSIQNWIVQTIFGAWVVFHLQQTSLFNSRKAERLNSSFKLKIKAIQELQQLIDKRLYASRHYQTVIENEKINISTQRTKYVETVTEWNEKTKSLQVIILLEFDSYFGLLLDHYYFPNFVQIDNLLRKQRNAVQKGEKPNTKISSSIHDLLAKINRVSIEVSRKMTKIAILDKNEIDGIVEITEENMERLRYGALFKALIKTPPQSKSIY